MVIYGDSKSGNCYKLQLLCSLLQLPYQWQHVDILQGETRHAEFLQKNLIGKIPLLMLDDGSYLAESNAILNYLAADSALLPTDSFALAKVQQWQFFEQYSHEPFIAVARYIAKYLGLPESRRADYEAKHAGGYQAFAVMETQLAQSPFLIGSAFTTADMSLYAYTHVAHEGGFSLADYPAIRNWIERISALPNYQPMSP